MKFFKKHKLISQKQGDFELWCEVIELIVPSPPLAPPIDWRYDGGGGDQRGPIGDPPPERGEHLTWEGLRKIVAIRAAMNWGLSDKLTIAFPDVGSVDRPLVDLPTKIDSEWLAGFTSAEGSIIINIKKSQNRVGYTVFLVPSPPLTPPPYLSFPLSEYLSFPFPLSRKGERDRQRKGEKRYPGMGTPTPSRSFPLSEYLSFPFPLSRKGERDRQRKGEKRYSGWGGGGGQRGPIGDPPPVFVITQHLRDENLIRRIRDYLNSGHV